jgi:hypothetical protein
MLYALLIKDIPLIKNCSGQAGPSKAAIAKLKKAISAEIPMTQVK